MNKANRWKNAKTNLVQIPDNQSEVAEAKPKPPTLNKIVNLTKEKGECFIIVF